MKCENVCFYLLGNFVPFVKEQGRDDNIINFLKTRSGYDTKFESSNVLAWQEFIIYYLFSLFT